MNKVLLVFFFYGLSIISAFAQTGYSIYTEKDWALRKKIMKFLATPLKSDLIVYRWGDLDEWDKLGGKENLPLKITQEFWEKKMIIV